MAGVRFPVEEVQKKNFFFNSLGGKEELGILFVGITLHYWSSDCKVILVLTVVPCCREIQHKGNLIITEEISRFLPKLINNGNPRLLRILLVHCYS